MSAYTKPILLRYFAGWARLEEGFVFEFRRRRKPPIPIRVPAGRVRDGASIPWFMESGLSKVEALFAGFVHDELSEPEWSHLSHSTKVAIFNQALRVSVAKKYHRQPVTRFFKRNFLAPLGSAVLWAAQPFGEMLGHKWGGEPPEELLDE